MRASSRSAGHAQRARLGPAAAARYGQAVVPEVVPEGPGGPFNEAARTEKPAIPTTPSWLKSGSQRLPQPSESLSVWEGL